MEQELVSSGVRVARSLVFSVVFNRSLFVPFLWPLCCLSFDLRMLITSMVFNTTFNNISVISWQQVLLEVEIGVPAGETTDLQ